MNARRLARSFVVLAGTFLLFHCSSAPGNTAQYAAADQDAEVARATGRFTSADGKYVVEVCEAGRSSPAVNDCQDSYVIQSGGRGERISDGTAGGVGCGGCPFDGVIMPLRATLALDAPPVTYDGIADFGTDDGRSLRRDNVDYDLVAANYFLNVFGRARMEAMAAHLTAQLKPGGTLMIADFAPPSGNLLQRLGAELHHGIPALVFALIVQQVPHAIYDYRPLLAGLGLRLDEVRYFQLYGRGPRRLMSLTATRAAG